MKNDFAGTMATIHAQRLNRERDELKTRLTNVYDALCAALTDHEENPDSGNLYDAVVSIVNEMADMMN